MSDELIQRVTFALPLHTFNLLSKLAASKGYRAASGLARALCEQAVGVVDFTPLSVSHESLVTGVEKVILGALLERPKTLSEIAEETGKWIQNLTPVMKHLLSVSWVKELEARYTGGRPARVFELAEAGRLRLEQEAERRRKNDEKAERDAAAQRAESARSHPDGPIYPPAAPPRLKATETETDQGKFIQAALDSLYREWPMATSEKVEPSLTKLVEATEGLIKAGYSTWADEIANVSKSYPEDLS